MVRNPDDTSLDDLTQEVNGRIYFVDNLVDVQPHCVACETIVEDGNGVLDVLGRTTKYRRELSNRLLHMTKES